MTKLQIISKLWSAIYDLVFLVKGTPTKSLEEIEADLDIVEYACRKYVDFIRYMNIINPQASDTARAEAANIS